MKKPVNHRPMRISLSDISNAIGISRAQVIKDKKSGRFSQKDLKSVAHYIISKMFKDMKFE